MSNLFSKFLIAEYDIEDSDLDDSYQCIWASSPYFELPQAVGMTHSFVHLIGQASTPMGGSEWFTTPYESTEGYCVQFQVQYGKTALFLIQQGDYSKISSWPDLAKCILQTKAIIDSPDLSGRPLSAYQVRRLSLHAGDCVVIPPGMIFFFSKRRSCSIISGCKFLCKETLHLTYPWMRVADFSNTDETIGKYWAVVKEAVGKFTIVTMSVILFIEPQQRTPNWVRSCMEMTPHCFKETHFGLALDYRVLQIMSSSQCTSTTYVKLCLFTVYVNIIYS